MEPSCSFSKIHGRSASDVDSLSFAIQNLSSILNNPLAGPVSSSSAWSLWPSAATDASPPPPPPAILPSPTSPASPSPPTSPPYPISSPYSRTSTTTPSLTTSITYSNSSKGLPSSPASKKFLPSSSKRITFKLACPFSESEEENLALQERLAGYLDTVEMHLVREILLRSDSFFEAQGWLGELNGKLVEACTRIRELKEEIRVLIGRLVGPARTVMELNAAR